MVSGKCRVANIPQVCISLVILIRTPVVLYLHCWAVDSEDTDYCSDVTFVEFKGRCPLYLCLCCITYKQLVCGDDVHSSSTDNIARGEEHNRLIMQLTCFLFSGRFDGAPILEKSCGCEESANKRENESSVKHM